MNSSSRLQLSQVRSTCFTSQHDTPKPYSQSQSYRSILLTFFTYIVLSTWGCSPRWPAVVMSTNRQENQSFPQIFKDLQQHTGYHKCGTLPTIKPHLMAIRFHCVMSFTRNKNSSQYSCRRLPVQLCYCKHVPKGPNIYVSVQEY